MRRTLLGILVISLSWTATAAAQGAGGVVVVGPLPSPVLISHPVVVAPPHPPHPHHGNHHVTTPLVDEAALRARLAEARRVNIDRFRAYVESESYPRNRYTPGLASVLIDDEDRFCAVASLMRQDGLEAFLRQTSRFQNDLRLATVTSGPLHDWILESGFTAEEIERIQMPFMEVPLTHDRIQERGDEREKRRLKRVYRRILSELQRDTRRSLAIATDRRAASHPSAPVVVRPEPSPYVVHPQPIPSPIVALPTRPTHQVAVSVWARPPSTTVWANRN